MDDRLQFFTSRIGQRVFRNKLPHLGEDLINEKGIVILSEMKAKSMYELECDEAFDIRYFDSKEEADKYMGV